MFKTLIEAEELAKLLGNPKLVVLDCRFNLAQPTQGLDDYMRSHIMSAQYVSLNNDLSDLKIKHKGRHPLPSIKDLEGLFSRLGVQPDSQVVAYDDADSGIAARLWWLLRYLGHEAVAVLNGGWKCWQALGLPIQKESKGPLPPAQFKAQVQPQLLVQASEVLNAPLVIDSRAPERFSGKSETLDPAAGHIPGAQNRFFKKNVDSEGKFLNPPELRKEFEKTFSKTDPKDVVFYCGSGVTACQNILAAAHAGLPQSKLYAGSWSEWCSDSQRPVEVSPAKQSEDS